MSFVGSEFLTLEAFEQRLGKQLTGAGFPHWEVAGRGKKLDSAAFQVPSDFDLGHAVSLQMLMIQTYS